MRTDGQLLWLDDRANHSGPQPIGELMPTVLARHGIDPSALRKPAGGNASVSLDSIPVQFSGMIELFATA